MVDIGPVLIGIGQAGGAAADERHPLSETALGSRVDEMLDACTRCGKCVEACPSVAPPVSRTQVPPTSSAVSLTSCARVTGPRRHARWASACMRSGECIKACDYGVNPRFLLTMARVAMAKEPE